MLLQKCDATVTIVHSRTPADAMESAVREADIVIAAAGRTEMVRGHWLKPGAVVIDVGINAVEVSARTAPESRPSAPGSRSSADSSRASRPRARAHAGRVEEARVPARGRRVLRGGHQRG